MPLDQFFDLYSQLSGRTILRPYQLPGQGITLKAQTDLTKRGSVEAMDGALALNSITMIPIGEKFVKAVPSTQAMQEGAPLSALTASEMPLAEQFITRVVKLKTAKPSELAPLFATFSKNPTAITPIDANQTIILRDYASNVKRMLEIIETVDVIPESDYKLEVIPIKYGKVTELYDTMNSLITGSGAPSSSARAPASTEPAPFRSWHPAGTTGLRPAGTTWPADAGGPAERGGQPRFFPTAAATNRQSGLVGGKFSFWARRALCRMSAPIR